MSKNKGYNNFYNKPRKEETTNEETKEVQTTEEAVETVQEETQASEEKVEEVSEEPIRQFAIVVGAKRVNMRKAPSKDGAILKVLDENTEVELLGIHDRTWTRIGHQGDVGYMMTMYLKPKN